MTIEYREARQEEINAISAIVAETFGEYPMYTLTFRDKFKSGDEFIRYITKLNRVHILANAKKHKCFVGVENGEIISIGLLQNPKIKRISLCDYIAAGGIRLLFPVGFRRLIDFFDISNAAHQDYETQHKDAWYIELLAVSSRHKGRSYGSKMISDCLIPYAMSQGGKKIALITNTENNCRFYEKNGFVKFSQNKLSWGQRSIMNYSYIRKI